MVVECNTTGKNTVKDIEKMLKQSSQKVERLYYDNDWTIDKIGDKIKISLFKDFHFVDEIFITKEMFENKTKD